MVQVRATSPPPIRFGIFELDLRTGELRRSGTKVRLDGQPFQVLALLLERAGELVSREELKGKLWPTDTFVDFEHGINTAVKRLRETLDDSRRSSSISVWILPFGHRAIDNAASENVTGFSHDSFA